jgi:6-phosphofructo-2-kinase/fructose-2,6-biphosphatase 4
LDRNTGEKSEATKALRIKTSTGCEQTIWDYFGDGGQVVIYDANNGTRAARQALAEKFDKAGVHVVILGAFTASNDRLVVEFCAESLCDNQEIIERNIRNVKISSPDVCMSLILIFNVTVKRV